MAGVCRGRLRWQTTVARGRGGQGVPAHSRPTMKTWYAGRDASAATAPVLAVALPRIQGIANGCRHAGGSGAAPAFTCAPAECGRQVAVRMTTGTAVAPADHRG